MKDVTMVWQKLTGRRYSAVAGDNAATNEIEEVTTSRNPKSLTRKSSVVVNQLFNAALPVHSDGRPRWSKSIFMLMILGFLSLVSGCFILIYQPYDLLFKLKVVFGEGGEVFEIWRKPAVELYLKVYLFNVTNHKEFISGKDSTLKFQQTGPYVYREMLEHGHIKFNDNGTISAIPIHPLQYEQEMSNGTEEDMHVLPNIALLSITNLMRDSSYISRFGLNMLIRQTDSRPLVPMTAKEFMFGYESTLVTLGNHMMPSWIKFDKLGLIDRMYDFKGDYETVYTGEDDVRLAGLIDTYNGDVNLPQWTGKCANVNRASDGVKFQNNIEPNDTLIFFRKSLCRSARIFRTGEKVINSLYTYKFNFVENELDNGAYNPENRCFCRQGRCLQPGLIDVTDCYYGFPIALSYPHFYKSDPSLLEFVEGLNPRQEEHESYFYIQPKSGIPVDISARFQINMALQDIEHMARVERFANKVIPLLWFDISMTRLPEAMNSRFILYLNVLPVVQDAIMYVFFLFGVIFLVWSVVKILLHQPTTSTILSGQWFDDEMQRKKLRFLNDRRSSLKTKEMDTFYNTLLSPSENVPTDPSSLKEENIV